MNDPAESHLSIQDKQPYKELFKIADEKKKLFLIKDEAISFFSASGIPSNFLKEIYNTVDKEQKDYITELEFYEALKLIACAQHGIQVLSNVLATQAPIPQFTGISLKPSSLSIAPLTARERDSYIGLFESQNPTGGVLHGEQAIGIFNKSGLPYKTLGEIWELADTRKSGSLNKTEFIIAMHYINRLMKDPSLMLPAILPSEVYSEASGKFDTSSTQLRAMPPLVGNIKSPQIANTDYTHLSPAISNSIPNSPNYTLNHPTASIILQPEEKSKYALYFNKLDNDGSGFIDGEEAAYFFNHSQLPPSELGIIWEIADSRHIGKLDLHDFCIAMHLINMRKRGESIDTYINALSSRQKHNNLGSPVIQEQISQQIDLSQIFELENQIIELKQQINAETERLKGIRILQQEEEKSIQGLENDIFNAKAELVAAKKNVDKAEEELKLEQQRNRDLSNQSPSLLSGRFSPSEFVRHAPTPELTRASSSLSAISPRSDFELPTPILFDPFAGFKKTNVFEKQQTSNQTKPQLSPQQSVAAPKYGFDLSAFDTLSIKQNAAFDSKSSIKDELSSLFGVTSLSETNNSNLSTKDELSSLFGAPSSPNTNYQKPSTNDEFSTQFGDGSLIGFQSQTNGDKTHMSVFSDSANASDSILKKEHNTTNSDFDNIFFK